MKQKVFKAGGQFTVTDEAGKEVYFVEGSFMEMPKTFSIVDGMGNEVAKILKKSFSFLPTFIVTVFGQKSMTIKKHFSLKARYTIDALGIEVQGNWSDMYFEVYQNSILIGTVRKEWLTWGAQYKLEIMEENQECLFVALVIVIHDVKSAQAAAESGG